MDLSKKAQNNTEQDLGSVPTSQSRRRIAGGGKSLKLQPQAEAVNTYYEPADAKAQVAKPDLGFAELSKAIGNTFNAGFDATELLKQKAHKEMQDYQIEMDTKLSWEEAIKKDDSLKSLNPFTKIYYEKFRAKNLTDDFLLKAQSENFIDPDCSYDEAERAVGQKIAQHISFLKEQGFSKNRILEQNDELQALKQVALNNYTKQHQKVMKIKNISESIDAFLKREEMGKFHFVSDMQQPSNFEDLINNFSNEGLYSDIESIELGVKAYKILNSRNLSFDNYDEDYDPIVKKEELLSSKVGKTGKTVREMMPELEGDLNEEVGSYKRKVKQIEHGLQTQKDLKREKNLELLTDQLSTFTRNYMNDPEGFEKNWSVFNEWIQSQAEKSDLGIEETLKLTELMNTARDQVHGLAKVESNPDVLRDLTFEADETSTVQEHRKLKQKVNSAVLNGSLNLKDRNSIESRSYNVFNQERNFDFSEKKKAYESGLADLAEVLPDHTYGGGDTPFEKGEKKLKYKLNKAFGEKLNGKDIDLDKIAEEVVKQEIEAYKANLPKPADTETKPEKNKSGFELLLEQFFKPTEDSNQETIQSEIPPDGTIGIFKGQEVIVRNGKWVHRNK